MSDRITTRDLDQLCRVLNQNINGNTDELWTRTDDGMAAKIGAYYIDGAYGGVALYRMVTDGGGVTDVFNVGHTTRRDLYNRIRAFLDGYDAAKRN